jgi:hypothetical protein
MILIGRQPTPFQLSPPLHGGDSNQFLMNLVSESMTHHSAVTVSTNAQAPSTLNLRGTTGKVSGCRLDLFCLLCTSCTKIYVFLYISPAYMNNYVLQYLPMVDI